MSKIISPLVDSIITQLISSGVSLEFKENSPLAPVSGEVELIGGEIPEASLESMIAGVNKYFAESDSDYNPFQVSNESVSLGNTFACGVESLVTDLLPIVTGILGRIKNNIIPATNEIFEVAYGNTTDIADKGGIKLEIITDGLDADIWKNAAFTNILEQYRELGEIDFIRAKGLTFPEMTSSEIFKLVTEVNTSLNGSLMTLLGDDAERISKEVYDNIFNVTGEDTIPWSRYHGDVIKYRIVAMLLCIALSENAPEGVYGVRTLEEYSGIMNEMIASHALNLSNIYQYGYNLANQQQLVKLYPEIGSEFIRGAQIVVNGLLWDRWLEEGGEVDTVYGAYVSGSNGNISDLNENSERYRTAWIRYVATKQSAIRDNFESHFVNALKNAIIGYAVAHEIKYDQDALAMMYDRTSNIDPDNAYVFARHAVISTLFEPGEFLPILEAVDTIADGSPDLPIEDAVDIATVEWLINWVMEQVNLKYNPTK